MPRKSGNVVKVNMVFIAFFAVVIIWFLLGIFTPLGEIKPFHSITAGLCFMAMIAIICRWRILSYRDKRLIISSIVVAVMYGFVAVIFLFFL